MRALLIFGVLMALPVHADEPIFQDDFKNGLEEGWKWVRETPEAWRTTDQGLEIRVLPGNMWGPPNNARNVLVRRLPDPGKGGLELSVKIQNTPTEQYEQVDLVWYYGDSHMVKIGLEQVDEKLCVVMGREEDDRTRTIAVLPKGTPTIRLRLTAIGDTVQGHYQLAGSESWEKAGECTLPVKGQAHVSLQAYQGPATVARWARITEFSIRRVVAFPR